MENFASFLSWAIPDAEEKKVQLHRLKSYSFGFPKLLLYTIIVTIGTLYWANVFFYIPDRSKFLLPFSVSVGFMVMVNVIALVLSACMTPEAIVASKAMDVLMILLVLSIWMAFFVVLCFNVSYELCNPMFMFTGGCTKEGYEYYSDYNLTIFFLPVFLQLAFGNISWRILYAIYIGSFLTCFYGAVTLRVIKGLPLLIISIICSAGSLLIGHSCIMKNYQISVEEEERKSMEQEVKLGQRLRLMISGVAHDLKSPLAAMALGVESIRQSLQSADRKLENGSEDISEVIRWMEATKDAMATIISRCVDVNQALCGLPLTPNFSLVNVATEAESIVKTIRSETENVKIFFDYQELLEQNMCTVLADRVWVVESLSCLLANAIKYSDTAHLVQVDLKMSSVLRLPPKTLMSCLAPEESTCRSRSMHRSALGCKISKEDSRVPYVRVEVHDEGLGISPSDQLGLFTYAGQSSTKVRFGGAGLGLFTMAKRIEALGGYYGFVSKTTERKTGSMFWFEIPVQSTTLGLHTQATDHPSVLSCAEKVEIDGTEHAIVPIPSPRTLLKAIPPNPSKAASSPVSSNQSSRSTLGRDPKRHMGMLSSGSTDRSVVGRKYISIKASNDEENDRVKSSASSSSSSSPSSEVECRLPLIVEEVCTGFTLTSSPQPVEVSSAIEMKPTRTPSLPFPPLIFPAASTSMPRRLRILVVDDSMPIRKMCAMVLTRQGHSVDMAINGKEALQMMTNTLANHLRQLQKCCQRLTSPRTTSIITELSDEKGQVDQPTRAPYDLVLMDLQMPVMDGIQAVTLYRQYEVEMITAASCSSMDLRSCESSTGPERCAVDTLMGSENEQLPILQAPTRCTIPSEHPPANSTDSRYFLPILAMSASSDRAIIDRALAAGTNAFLAKPFQLQQFDDTVARLLTVTSSC